MCTYLFRFSEWHLLSRELGKSLEYMSVEHASVEIDLLIPAIQTFLPLMVNVLFVSLVVGLPESLLVIASSEGVQVIVPLVKVWVGLGTKGHAELKERQSFEHIVVSRVNLISFVMVKDGHKLVIKIVMV